MFVWYSVSYFVRISAVMLSLFSCCVIQGAQFRINSDCNQPRGDYCTLIYDCPYFAHLMENHTLPLPIMVIDVIRRKQCGYQGNNPKVCCDYEISQPTENSIEFAQIESHPNLNLLPNDDCGKTYTKFRITNGDQTELLEFPWMALLTFYRKGKIEFNCSGSVINKWYILTAAHWTTGSELFRVRLGEHDLKSRLDCNPIHDYCAPPVQDLYTSSVTRHPNYTSRLWLNDIALIRLATPADFSRENVQPICLPVHETTNVNFIGRYLTVSGWGIQENEKKSEILRKVTVPVLPFEVCSEMYKNYAVITHKQICAGGEIGRDSCSGDSGAPLKYAISVDGSSRYVQYGIASFRPSICGMKPAIYTSVIHYVKWILDNLKP